jgi:hypothetical protein
LAGIHTPATLPYLARLLDSTDRRVRLEAYGGFIAFVLGRPIQTPENTVSGLAMNQPGTIYSSDGTWKKCSIGWDAPDAELDAMATCWKNWLRSHSELPQVDAIPAAAK